MTAIAQLIATLAALANLTPTTIANSHIKADDIRKNQWHLRYLNAREAQRISAGQGVTVAVVDTGSEPHPDLRRNLLNGSDVILGGKGRGQTDNDGHGTGMAGLIAAHGKDEKGALGIAPKSRILPILAIPATEQGSSDKIAAGIEWATLQRVSIISISAVGGPSIRLQQAIESAIKTDVLIVAGVGNKPNNYGIGYPAAFPGVLSVGGIDQSGHHSSISVTGPEILISAPSDDIYSTSKDGKYRRGTGTSAATAIVAGAAALVRSKYPHLPAQEVIHRLTATAVDKGAPGRDEEYGYGVLDIVAALTADVPPLGFESPAVTGAKTPSTTATASAAGPDGAGGPGWRLPLLTLGVLGLAGLAGLIWWRQRRPASG